MQVPSISYTQNNNNRYNQSFTSIKSFECTGLYKKYPELAKELVDTVKKMMKLWSFVHLTLQVLLFML